VVVEGAMPGGLEEPLQLVQGEGTPGADLPALDLLHPGERVPVQVVK
jgi:hypothetical protein